MVPQLVRKRPTFVVREFQQAGRFPPRMTRTPKTANMQAYSTADNAAATHNQVLGISAMWRI